MQLLEQLRAEHVLIETMLGALRTYAARVSRSESGFEDRDRFVRFFTVYAGALHHEKEETVLFPAMTRDVEVPSSGPIDVILRDHERLHAILERLASTSVPAEFDALATSYSHQLWAHIDVENSVLFPECELQLRRSGVSELPVRELTAEEREAEAMANELVERYPPGVPDSLRGDGCVMCHAYGDTCRGIEREWWNEWAWEEFDEHVAAS